MRLIIWIDPYLTVVLVVIILVQGAQGRLTPGWYLYTGYIRYNPGCIFMWNH